MESSSNHAGRRVPWPIAGIGTLGGRAVIFTLRPLSGVVGTAAGAGAGLERRAVNRLLDGPELERLLLATLNDPRVRMAFQRALESDGTQRLVDLLFDSGLIDRFLERLLVSDSLWHLIDEIASSPAVTAAISQQGLGFADQVGDEMRTRSRKADDWMERTARRLIHRQPRPLPAEPDPSM